MADACFGVPIVVWDPLSLDLSNVLCVGGVVVSAGVLPLAHLVSSACRFLKLLLLLCMKRVGPMLDDLSAVHGGTGTC